MFQRHTSDYAKYLGSTLTTQTPPAQMLTPPMGVLYRLSTGDMLEGVTAAFCRETKPIISTKILVDQLLFK